MKTPRAWLVAFVAAAVLAVVAILFPHEPRYHGRTLTSWLQQYYDGSMMDTQQVAEARSAIRAIGAEKTVPVLMRLVTTKEDPISSYTIEQSKKLKLDSLKWHSAEDFQQLGIAGFEVLDTNAASTSVIAELTKMLDDPSHAFVAVRCLVFLGPTAEDSMCKALTNASVQIRQYAASQMSWVSDDDVRYIKTLTRCLADSEGSVRFAAIQGIGAQTQAPELAIPILIETLEKHDGNVSGHAAQALVDFGTNALPLVPRLSRVTEGSNFDYIARQALRTMAAIAPAQALPLLLTNCQSNDPHRRQAALRELIEHRYTNDAVSAEIALATHDPDPKIARYVQNFLTENYQREHPDESAFLAEPSYAGRTLGAWLKDRDHDGQLSPAVKDALRQMGTNATSALFARLTFVRPPFGEPANEINFNAAGGFIALGNEALPALPRLLDLMESTNRAIALSAMIASFGTGSNALPFVLKGLTNQFADLRNTAASTFSEGIDGLGPKFPEQSQQVVPLITALLKDPDEDVRMNATNELKQIDPQAAAMAGIK